MSRPRWLRDADPLPGRFQVARAARVRSRIMMALAPWRESVVTPELVDILVRTLRSDGALPRTSRPEAVRESLVGLLPARLDPRAAERVAWRISGSVSSLRREECAIPATPRVDERRWAPVFIRSCEPERGMDGQDRWALDFRVIDGPWSGLEIRRAVTPPRAESLARRLGYRKGRYVKAPLRRGERTVLVRARIVRRSYRELAGLRAMVLLVPDPGRATGFRVERTAADPAALKYNRDVIAGRVGPRPCVNGRRERCHRCPLGLSQCRHAVRLEPLEEEGS